VSMLETGLQVRKLAEAQERVEWLENRLRHLAGFAIHPFIRMHISYSLEHGPGKKETNFPRMGGEQSLGQEPRKQGGLMPEYLEDPFPRPRETSLVKIESACQVCGLPLEVAELLYSRHLILGALRRGGVVWVDINALRTAISLHPVHVHTGPHKDMSLRLEEIRA